jgi:selenocysteine lyase/cysteine desulfurase
VDILATGAQKWLCSPWGSGFAYVRAELVAGLEPPAAGWLSQASTGDLSNLLDYDPAWRDDAQRFEVGTIPFHDVVGMNASLELLLEVGPARIEAHVRTLADRIVAWSAAPRGTRLLTPENPSQRAGIVAIVTADVEGDSRRLRAAGFAHSLREGAVRFAPHFHNTLEEVDRALRVIEGAAT